MKANAISKFVRRLTAICLSFLTASLFIATPATATSYPADLVNSLGMHFVALPSGEFTMGSEDIDAIILERPDGNTRRVQDETPAHRVRISKSFFLGRTEVTQEQWFNIMQTRPGPDSHWNRDDWRQLPVVAVSWFDALTFIRRLNRLDGGRLRYRLPSEAEWEYAARAGSTGIRALAGDKLAAYAWYIENSGDIVHPVASRKANAWGLHDMLGNVWEWVNDWYAPDTYTGPAMLDPTGPPTGTKKILRGGSYHCQPHLVRPAYRSADDPAQTGAVTGFRLIAEPAAD